ncbi:type II toxin-antitoxin system VapC family toxin [Mycobacterium sp.]|uniref:type II toxin-antitoxin system VapC family toxin n=1 Tax=Mycobacterium sp. TaxID=1785 RepID=UPI003A83AC22
MIVLDASVLIAFLAGDDAHHGAAEEFIADAVDEELAVNPLTLAEVLVAPVRDGRLDTVVAALAALEVRELSFPDETSVPLARLRAETGLKMPDCCVLLAAEAHRAGIATFDRRLAALARQRGIPAVRP